jgi:hypothetical protein
MQVVLNGRIRSDKSIIANFNLSLKIADVDMWQKSQMTTSGSMSAFVLMFAIF